MFYFYKKNILLYEKISYLKGKRKMFLVKGRKLLKERKIFYSRGGKKIFNLIKKIFCKKNIFIKKKLVLLKINFYHKRKKNLSQIPLRTVNTN